MYLLLLPWLDAIVDQDCMLRADISASVELKKRLTDHVETAIGRRRCGSRGGLLSGKMRQQQLCGI